MSITWSPRRIVKFNGDSPLRKSPIWLSLSPSRASNTLCSGRWVCGQTEWKQLLHNYYHQSQSIFTPQGFSNESSFVFFSFHSSSFADQPQKLKAWDIDRQIDRTGRSNKNKTGQYILRKYEEILCWGWTPTSNPVSTEGTREIREPSTNP